ncbi:MAG TPA: hypothetical protein VGI81_29355, partial [Tepidisphaeraceae bacterium]
HGRDPNLSRRNELYLRILNLGLLRIRGAAYDGGHQHCEIEADHLHNIPSYIAGGDAAHHLYYLAKEIPYYLDRIDRTVAANVDLLRWYAPLWRELETLVPVEGSPWERDWRELKAGGWDCGRV